MLTVFHSRFGDRCFAAAGPRIWNNLPASLRDKKAAQNSETTENIYVSDGLRRIVTFLILRLINTLTYLFTYLRTDRRAPRRSMHCAIPSVARQKRLN